MQAFSKWDKGIKYLLNVIDVFSKFAWSVPLKDKTGKSITDAFQHIVKSSKRKRENYRLTKEVNSMIVPLING